MQGLLFDSPAPGLKSKTEMFEPPVSAHVPPTHPGSPFKGDKGEDTEVSHQKRRIFCRYAVYLFLKTG